MCNSAEQSGGDHVSDLKNDSGVTLESDLRLIRVTNGIPVSDNMKETSVQNTSVKAAEEAVIDTYKDAEDLEMQVNMQHSEKVRVDQLSVAGSIGEFECHPSRVQEVNRESAALREERHEEESIANMDTCSVSGCQVVESKALHSGQVTMKETEQNAKEHNSKNLNETYQDPSIEIEQQDSHVPFNSQLAHASITKGVNGPELAEFFSNARGSKHEVEIEEQDYAPIRVRSTPKRKSYTESPRSLRMLLFSDETVPFAKKEENPKRDGKSMEFSNKVVPASEGLVDEGHNEDINFPKWHESGDTMEATDAFSGPLAFSGALTYQGIIPHTGPSAYSGSISHRSDSSTSTRSFAFPILASDWNTSPVKMVAPDPRFFRQQRKWHFCLCCRRPSTLFD